MVAIAALGGVHQRTLGRIAHYDGAEVDIGHARPAVGGVGAVQIRTINGTVAVVVDAVVADLGAGGLAARQGDGGRSRRACERLHDNPVVAGWQGVEGARGRGVRVRAQAVANQVLVARLTHPRAIDRDHVRGTLALREVELEIGGGRQAEAGHAGHATGRGACVVAGDRSHRRQRARD